MESALLPGIPSHTPNAHTKHTKQVRDVLRKDVPSDGLHMTLSLLQRDWAAAEEERAQALRSLQREHQEYVESKERELLLLRRSTLPTPTNNDGAHDTAPAPESAAMAEREETIRALRQQLAAAEAEGRRVQEEGERALASVRQRLEAAEARCGALEGEVGGLNKRVEEKDGEMQRRLAAAGGEAAARLKEVEVGAVCLGWLDARIYQYQPTNPIPTHNNNHTSHPPHPANRTAPPARSPRRRRHGQRPSKRRRR